MAPPAPTTYRAVIFDLGGVVFPSPFEAFDAYEARAGLPPGSVRAVVRVSSETGAWAAFERGELDHDAFFAAIDAEGAAAGCALDARALMASLGTGHGARPEMLHAIALLRAEGLRVGALTNNWAAPSGAPDHLGVAALDCFDAIVESSRVGLRKPDPRIYELVCERLDVTAPESVFLDDLGVNLKPARAMGMATIKVTSSHAALRELSGLVGIELIERG